MSKHFFALAFAAGLASVAWVGFGFVGASWFALAMTALIAGVYLLGAFELLQFRRATAALSGALGHIPQPLDTLATWLDAVPASLRTAVRLRVEGERAVLPGPALTPYLIGLLVMLGMLGTFLGMVVTFRGAVLALEGSADLQAIRAALAGPIKGLALAFGCSVAGVAASAMLGLMSAIARRERIDVARRLDGRIAGELQPFSLVHQRQETFRALQLQSRVLPEVASQLATLIARLEQRGEQHDTQLLERHAVFQREAALAYTQLADKVGGALAESLASGARAAGQSIEPVVASAMERFVAETRKTQVVMGEIAASQVETLSREFAATARTMSDGWTAALAGHARTEQQRLQGWTDGLQATGAELRTHWQRAGEDAIGQQRAAAQALEEAAARIAEHAGEQAGQATEASLRLLDQAQALVRERQAAEARADAQRQEVEARDQARHRERLEQLAATWRTELQALRQDAAAHSEAAIERLAQLEAAAGRRLETLGAAVEGAAARIAEHAGEQAGRAAEASLRLLEQSQHLVRERQAAEAQAHAQRQEAEARDQAQHRERMEQLAGVWRTELQALRQDEAARGDAAIERLGQLEAAASRHLATLGAALEDPITRLLQTAADVPRAAAGVIAQLHEQVGATKERDNAALQERTLLLERLAELLQSLQQASGEQRAAIDTLVTSASAVLQEAGSGWMQALDAQAGKAGDMAAQLAGSAVELASLAEAFGASVQAFQASNQALAATLERVEASLATSAARSDEQLAYYVAQAREVIDLSIASQQGVFETLRQLQARPPAPAPEETPA